jgi:Tfp pilus assembly protein PilF
VNPFQKQFKVIVVIVVLFMLAFVYSGHFHNGFFYDDVYCIQQNLALQSLKNIPAFFSDAHSFASIPAYQTYRPFYLLSFAIDYYIGNGPSPVVMHVHTFIGFIFLCVLLFFFSKKIFSHLVSDPFYPSLLAVCIFAFHPTTADVINYHYARADSFAALHGMLAVVLYLYWPLAKKYYIYLIPLFVGCMFKINAGMYIPMLWIYMIFFEHDNGLHGLIPIVKKTFKEVTPALLVVLGSAVLILIKSTASDTSGVTRTVSLMTQAHVMMNYFMLFFLPENINPNGWRDYITSPFDYHFISGMLFLLVMGLIIYVTSLFKSTRAISFGLLWFFVFLLPVSVLLTLIVPQVDYYVFNSMIGISIAVSACITIVFNRVKQYGFVSKYVLVIVSLVMVCSFAYGSRKRVKVWSSDKAMYEDVLKKDPTNGRELMNYGTVLMGEGKIPDAEQYFEKAKLFAPYYDLVYVNLGVIRNMYNDTVSAEADFKRAVELNGWDLYMAHFFYGRYLTQRHRIKEALVQLNEAVREYPSYTDAWHLLMDIYFEIRDKELAPVCRQVLQLMPNDTYASGYLRTYMQDSLKFTGGSAVEDSVLEKTIASHPTAESYISLSLTYFNKGEYKKVIEACKKAIELDPKSAVAYNNMCAAYNNLQQWDEAIDAGKKALKIQPDFTLAQNNLNFALQQKQKK